MDVSKQIVVLLNGPKNSGKNFIADNYDRLVTVCPQFHPLEPGRRYIEIVIGHPIGDYEYETTKDSPRDELNGMSIREAMIDFSENIMKPRFGEDIFTRLMWNKMQEKIRDRIMFNQPAVPFFCVSLGFDAELESLLPISKLESLNVLLVKVTRRGCDFKNDSRGYVDRLMFPGIEYLELDNGGHIEETIHILEDKINSMQQINF